MLTISTENIPIKIWTNEFDNGTIEQAKNLANLPFAKKHIAVMPDCHVGYGMPIGGVLATEGVIIPNAVGVDIGCGMCSIPTNLRSVKQSELQRILHGISKTVPVGFKHHHYRQDESKMPSIDNVASWDSIALQEYDNAAFQVGTLGSGNHFIEVQKGDDGFIHVMIHSGSRNIGKTVADYYNKLAIRLNEEWDSPVPKNWQLAYLPIDSKEGGRYIKEMQFCVEFALANRKLMLERVMEQFVDEFPDVKFGEMVNIPHNYSALEEHDGMWLWVHRKGATRALEGEIGIIPGSQGSKSYLVRGKGNKESFSSCSHGAGRKMGRNEARKKLNLEYEKKELNRMGVLHAIRGEKDLDEAPGAYKDIDKVMANQIDLVDIILTLEPLAVVKG